MRFFLPLLRVFVRPLAPRLLARLAGGALPTWLAALVFAELQRDARLAAEYDALRRMERAVSLGPAALSSSQIDLLEGLILDSAAEADQKADVARRPSWRAAWAGALAAASVAAFLFLPTRSASIDDLRARGSLLQQAPLGVRVSCLVEDGVAPGQAKLIDTATAGARQASDHLRCPTTSVLAFSTTNLSSEVRHVFILGIAADGSRRWYAPFTKDAASAPVAPGSVDAVLPVLADTAALPTDTLALHVLLSDRPIHGATIERQLALAALRGVPLGHIERLPVDVPLQARIDLGAP